MAPVMSRISAVAQFDDLCRYTAVLTEGHDSDILATLQTFQTYEKRHNAKEENETNLRKMLEKTRTELETSETKLKHMKNLVDKEMEKRRKAEAERDNLERQITIIREVLLSDQNMVNNETREKLAFLNTPVSSQDMPGQLSPTKKLETINESGGSVLSGSDISFDQTEEDPDMRNPHTARHARGKRNQSQEREDPAMKRLRNREVVMYLDGKVRTRRSSSDPGKGTDHSPPPRQSSRSESDRPDLVIAPSLPSMHFKFPSQSTPIRQVNSTSKLNNRAHTFCTKTVLRPEDCQVCGFKIRFYKQAMKCEDCRATCHPECKDKVALPCVPSIRTPTAFTRVGTIADYAPSYPPMIPALMIHCINEIESRGLNEVGLYRISGPEKDVKEVKEKFLRGKGVPNLSKVDVHVLCGVVKTFLRDLQEKLITRTLWRDFVTASELNDSQDGTAAMYQAISELPQPNRDTLAYLILHLQRVAENPDCKMPCSNLAKIFGPTVVGTSISEPDPMRMIRETIKQHQVMEKLLKIPWDYWNNFVNIEDQGIPISTPEKATRRFPVTYADSNEIVARKLHKVLGKSPLTPRRSGGPGRRTAKRRRFFASPKAL